MESTRHMIKREYGGRRGWLFSRAFWRDALERAVRLAAGAALVALGAGTAAEDAGGELDPGVAGDLVALGLWKVAAAVAAAAALLSLLTSLAAGLVGDRGTAAFLPRE